EHITIHSDKICFTLKNGLELEEPYGKEQLHMQRRTPIGYCVKDGKAEIDPKQSTLVREIFESYLQGMSTLKIAKLLTEREVLNANQKPYWNHGRVGKIL